MQLYIWFPTYGTSPMHSDMLRYVMGIREQKRIEFLKNMFTLMKLYKFVGLIVQQSLKLYN